jgi:TonB family protein
VALLAGMALTATVRAQDAPLQAGSEGVPVPKRSKTLPPQYPPEAQAQGIRGIVILELVVDAQGKVESVNVIRSVPGLDQAAVEAARQWEYEITRVGGKPVSVRLTVPITFAMRLPEMSRQDGIPELRQGAAPPFPEGERGAADVTADLTVDAEGQVLEAQVTQGEVPWTDVVMRALRTWRFASPGEGVTVSFRVHVEFIPGRGKDGQRVALRLDGLRRSEAFDSASSAPAAAPSPAAPTAAEGPTATTPTTAPAAPPAAATPVAAPPPVPAVPSPSPSPARTAAAPAAPTAPTSPAPPASTAAAPPPTVAPAPTASAQAAPAQTAGKPAPPPVEVISAPPPPEPVESGSSAVRDVVLAEAGVPDLTRGRRPVVPPFARMTGTKGGVEVDFSVGASGITSVQSVKGPDLLRPAAEQTVVSWIFRRTKVDRLYLVALFNYDGDKVTASVKPQPPANATP